MPTMLSSSFSCGLDETGDCGGNKEIYTKKELNSRYKEGDARDQRKALCCQIR
jgi:hypothetical protein